MFLGRTHHEIFVCNTELQTKVSSCVRQDPILRQVHLDLANVYV